MSRGEAVGSMPWFGSSVNSAEWLSTGPDLKRNRHLDAVGSRVRLHQPRELGLNALLYFLGLAADANRRSDRPAEDAIPQFLGARQWMNEGEGSNPEELWNGILSG